MLEHSPFPSILDAVKRNVRTLLSMIAAMYLAQVVLRLVEHPFASAHLSYYLEDPLWDVVYYLAGGLASVIGMIFLCLDLTCVIRLLRDEGSRLDAFFIIAACQIGLVASTRLVNEWLFFWDYFWALLVALAVLALLRWIIKKLLAAFDRERPELTGKQV